ncbi:helix-turn-helix domain-containing protein [Gemmiger sp.]
MTIGQRVKLRREELGLSQEELAKRIGYKSKTSINKIELDFRNLTHSKIKAIADALETTPSYIMGWDEEAAEETKKAAPSEEDSLNAEIIKLFMGLTADQKKEALNYLRYLSTKSENP